jgi:hypothetical protein
VVTLSARLVETRFTLLPLAGSEFIVDALRIYF